VFEEEKGSDRKLTLSLFDVDMRRIGSVLADLFCKKLSGGDPNFEQEAGATQIKEVRAQLA
jgi:hypothetical protein